ncbi:MAG: polymorphic toxin-type HINT domain-containing protein [Alphaproteobacteria bacterium]|nr:polymorphic toxin-type HINT domain-containing protein [Alphaproteobacteria bacterium]
MESKQHRRGKPFSCDLITILLGMVISLVALSFSSGFKTDDNRSAISSTTVVQTEQRSIDDEEVTPETWRSINLEMHKADGSIAKVDLLRPLWWLEEAKAEVGGTIALSMSEMGIEGEAKVLSIGPCKAYSRKGDSKYRVVTGKFTHENAIVLDLAFNNDPNNSLGITPNHPLWSQTRNGWVEAGQLKVGEYVKTKDGIAQLTMRNQRPGRHKVYNLEVHKDHTYYVSNLDILAHNSCANGRGLWTVDRYDKVVDAGKFGKAYRDPKTGLWWSKDTAGHGGSTWKVFEETKTGLKWKGDADQFGDFLKGKHKGPIGEFIPWKNTSGR